MMVGSFRSHENDFLNLGHNHIMYGWCPGIFVSDMANDCSLIKHFLLGSECQMGGSRETEDILLCFNSGQNLCSFVTSLKSYVHNFSYLIPCLHML